ncbi:DUF3795 domain-containing protein [Desulfomonile tiedjei]|uniref:DUF3795 domain-containing protein n=1 Tax=Desulfomonile tiedjei (strain ATCC 49306 / DSM 6799 / DCB-1) TaxID=706587 RepID=I4CBQ4_DESTA|nr:DUF3795 domain-containing protein [Desulfomonile tiedjei]AFM26995.1 hypothetical protein Desti_4362 [Desulfomonile tiedjei DSM 6799]
MDYIRMTAPCGLPCFACYLYLANEDPDMRALVSKELGIPPEKAVCKGCRDEGGKCSHLPMNCRVYPCADRRGISFCCDCPEFPCDFLQPYADNAKLWHNTKVFNLCLIKKMGLEHWAKTKAERVLRAYSCEKWRL